jgi:hypothetical protein
MIAVRLLTPVTRNAVGINLGAGPRGGELVFRGVLAAVTARRRVSVVRMARAPPIEALRIGQLGRAHAPHD